MGAGGEVAKVGGGKMEKNQEKSEVRSQIEA